MGGHNIPIPLKRRDASSLADLANGVGFEAAEPEGEAVVDLRRRKSLTPPLSFAPPPRPPPASVRDIASFVTELRRASSRDAVLDILVAGARTLAGKVAVLVARRGELAGWTCSPEMADRDRLRASRLSATGSHVLGPALESGSGKIVRIPKDATHAPLHAALHAPLMGDVALVPIRVDEKAVALLIAADLEIPGACLAGLDELAAAAGDALSEVLRTRRK